MILHRLSFIMIFIFFVKLCPAVDAAPDKPVANITEIINNTGEVLKIKYQPTTFKFNLKLIQSVSLESNIKICISNPSSAELILPKRSRSFISGLEIPNRFSGESRSYRINIFFDIPWHALLEKPFLTIFKDTRSITLHKPEQRRVPHYKNPIVYSTSKNNANYLLEVAQTYKAPPYWLCGDVWVIPNPFNALEINLKIKD